MQPQTSQLRALRLPLFLITLIGILFLSACAGSSGGSSAPSTPTAQASSSGAGTPSGDPQLGKQAIQKYGCGNCHTIAGIDGANGTVGPNLSHYASLPQIVNTVPNTPDNTVKWIMNPQSIKPGTAMPTLGVSQTDAQNIAAYLYTLK